MTFMKIFCRPLKRHLIEREYEVLLTEDLIIIIKDKV